MTWKNDNNMASCIQPAIMEEWYFIISPMAKQTISYHTSLEMDGKWVVVFQIQRNFNP